MVLSTLVFVFIIIGFILLAVTRSVYRILRPYQSDADAYFHLQLTEEIRSNGHRLPKSPQQVVTSGVYGYPYLLHWLLSYLPRPAMPYVDRFFSPLMDLGVLLLAASLVPLGYLDLAQFPVVLTVLIATPQLVRPDQAQAIGLSARKPGTLVTTGAILALVIYVDTGAVSALAISIGLASVVPLLSKFSLQAMTVLLTVLAIFVAPEALLILFMSFVLAIILSRGHYLTVLRTHLKHLRDYAVSKQYKRFDHSIPSPVSFSRQILAADSPMAVAQTIFESRRLFPFFCNIPVIVALLGLVWAAVAGIDVAVSQPILVWLFAGVAAAFFTSLPHLLFLGEPERYLEYVYVPAFIVLGKSWLALGTQFHAAVSSLVIIGLILILGFYWTFQTRLFDPEREASIDDIVDRLNGLPQGTLIIHPSVIARNIIWFTDHDVVETLGNQATTDAAVTEYNRLFPEKHSRITDDIEWLRDQYHPDWVVYDLRWFEPNLPNSLYLPSSEPIYANEHFELYSFDTVAETDDHTESQQKP